MESHQIEAKHLLLCLEQAAASTKSQVVTCSDNLIQRIDGIEQSLKNNFARPLPEEIMNIPSQIADAQVHFNVSLDKIERTSTDVALGVQQHTITASDIHELKDMLALHLQHTRYSQASIGQANQSARIMLTLTLPQLNITRRDLEKLLQYLSAEVETILRLFFAIFLVSLRDLLLVLPQIFMIYKLLQRLPQAISLVLHDNMTFEDALGRVQSLQYQQFKHWTVFEASLRCSFDGLPGIKQVLNGHFLLTSPEQNERLTSSNWVQLVKPGLEIRMSMSIKNLNIVRGACPRNCRAAVRKDPKGEFCCSKCGLLFFHGPLRERPQVAKAATSSQSSAVDSQTRSIIRQTSNELTSKEVNKTSLPVKYSENRNDQSTLDDKPSANSTSDMAAALVEEAAENELIKVMRRLHVDRPPISSVKAAAKKIIQWAGIEMPTENPSWLGISHLPNNAFREWPPPTDPH